MNKIKDLTGMRFTKLVAIEPTEKRIQHYTVWRCKCDCGKECYVDSGRLQRGTIESCGCEKKKGKYKTLDLKGQRYGKLVVIERAENRGERTTWLCRCDCGNEKVVTTHELRAGNTKSCGCLARKNVYYRDLEGQRFGYLTVLEKTEKRDYKGSVLWKCRCDCGNEVLYSADSLLHSPIKSCGCYRKNEILKNINKRIHKVDGTIIERLNLQKPRSDNKSGHVGVHKTPENHYHAVIGFKGKHYSLGTYLTLEEAINARHKGEKIHTDFLKRYYKNHE